MTLSDNIRPEPYRPPTADDIRRAREMYTLGFTVSRTLAATDMSLGTLYFWLDGGPRDENGTPSLPPIPRRREVVGKRRKPLNASRVSLVARLYRTAERQVRDIEQRLAQPSEATPERERDVRMLASLVQSLRGLSTIAPGEGTGAPAARLDDEPHDDMPEDIDEFRIDLARRIDAFVASRTGDEWMEKAKAEQAAEAAAQAEQGTAQAEHAAAQARTGEG